MDCEAAHHEVVWNQGIDEPYGRQWYTRVAKWECFPWFQIIWTHKLPIYEISCG